MKKLLVLLTHLFIAFNGICYNQFDFSAIAPTGQTLYYKMTPQAYGIGGVTVTYPTFLTEQDKENIYLEVNHYEPYIYTNNYYTGYTKPSGHLVIPDSVSYNGVTYPVTRIDGAFHGCIGLRSVVIPSTVKRISGSSFYLCTNLDSITIPNSVTGSLDYTFTYCIRLKKARIGDGVTQIKNSTFSSCYQLTTVYLGAGLQSMTGQPFEKSDHVSSIHMRALNPPTVTNTTFDSVPSTATIYIPCGSHSAYQNAAYWQDLNLEEEFPYTFSATTSDITRGTVQIIREPSCDNYQSEIQANPYYGFHFTRWSDGNTDAHRYLVVIKDTAIQAEFAEGNGPNGITDIPTSTAMVFCSHGSIIVEGIKDETVTLYDIQGRVLGTQHCNNSQLRFDVPNSGVYMLRIGTSLVRRIVLKR